MTETRTCACDCGASLTGMRADAVYYSEACEKRHKRRASTDKAPTHPLEEVRVSQATKKHNRDLGGLIRQAIIDRLKTTGECHCDDLVSLYPEGEVAECRRLATAQFGSLAKCKLIHHPGNEWRASASGTRKGGGGWVWRFTKAGWDKYGRAGVHAGGSSTPPDDAAKASCGSEGMFTASVDSGEAGLTGPGSGADAETSNEPPGPKEAPVISTASSDKQLAGVSAGGPSRHGRSPAQVAKPGDCADSGETRNCLPDSGIGTPSPQGSGGAILPCSSAGTALPDQSVESPEPLSLLPEPDPESWAA